MYNLFDLVRGIWFLEEIFANGTEKGKGKVYLTAGLLKKNSMWDFQGLGNIKMMWMEFPGVLFVDFPKSK